MDGKRNSVQSSAGPQVIDVQLDEQNQDFAVDKKKPVAGRLQIKGTAVLFKCSNLKPYADGYKLFFIGRKNGSSIYKIIEEIIPDRQGNAELQCRINPADIDGEGTDLSCFYIFMIAAMGRPMQMVMKGDLLKMQSDSKVEQKQKKVPKPRSVISNRRQDRSYNHYYSKYILAKIDDLKRRTPSSADISPFNDAWLAPGWKRVTDCSRLPVASVGAEQQIRKYGHFIYGSNGEYFYLGVPGRHTEDEWPDRGGSGFLLWQSIRGSEEYGYWTMVIDCKTGIITEIP